MSRVLIIIPARSGSKRLKNKNILPIKNLPMFVYVAKEASKSRFKPEIYVSSESKKILNICKKFNIKFLKRPSKLSGDNIEKQEVISFTFKKLRKKLQPKIIVSLQPNSPEFKFNHLDKEIVFFLKKAFPKKEVKEVVSIGKNNLQNGAFRIMTPKTVTKKTLSTNIGVFKTDYMDIHNLNEYKKAKKRIERN